MSEPLLVLLFAAAASASLGLSWQLAGALERIGARLGLSEALLGLLAALAADAPEITAASTALVRHAPRVGAGVVIGSNVFKLAALLGLAGVIAGSIALHRRVIELAGAVAILLGCISLLVVAGLIGAPVGLALALAVMAPYALALGIGHERLRGRGAWRRWLLAAVTEEELELEVEAATQPERGGGHDAALALAATALVVGASIAMEHAASDLGTRWAVPEIVTGGLVLAAVTSLPNAVTATYLALRGRGSAVLSTALNSNAINILAGLLVPTSVLGVGRISGEAVYVAIAYLLIAALALGAAHRRRGLHRLDGLAIIAAYLLFVCVLIAISL